MSCKFILTRGYRRRLQAEGRKGKDMVNIPVQIPFEMLYRLAFEERGTEEYAELQKIVGGMRGAIEEGQKRLNKAAVAKGN